MLGKTHMAVGIAATLTITHPSSVRELLAAVGMGTVGALISDIDVGTSQSHKDADRISFLTAAAVIVTLVLDYFWQAGICDRILQNSGIVRIIAGILLFVGVCAWGKEQPHRSFMHSFLALIILSFAIWLVYPPLIPYFGVGFLSHLATDIFNMRKVKLLYPVKGGIALGFFHARGMANNLLCTVGSVIAAAEVVGIVWTIVR